MSLPALIATFAYEPERQFAKAIRVYQGSDVEMQQSPGKKYRVDIRANRTSHGHSIRGRHCPDIRGVKNRWKYFGICLH